MQPLQRVRILLLQYHGWQGSIRTQAKSITEQQTESSSTCMARGAEQSAMEETRKERTVEGETKEYATKDEITEETVEVQRNYLSVPAIYYLRTTLLIERARKDIL